jgi:hypothetical protein
MKIPIILIDCSGSTDRDINIAKYYDGVDNVLKYELNIAQRILRKMTHVYVIMFNIMGIMLSKTPILVSELQKIRPESFGGTYLSKGLDEIPSEWLSEKEKNELYIFTDGEIDDEEIVASPLKKLLDSNCTIQIITVEPNDTNYMKTKTEAGNKLFQVIKSNGLTNFVRRFSSYNEHHVVEPFIIFDNPEKIEGFAPFQGVYYDTEKQKDEIMEKIEEEIKNCETKEELIDTAHKVSVTLDHMSRDKPYEEQIELSNQIADLFAESYVDPTMFIQVNKMLLLEAHNHSIGSASTFHDFKDALIVYSSNE